MRNHQTHPLRKIDFPLGLCRAQNDFFLLEITAWSVSSWAHKHGIAQRYAKYTAAYAHAGGRGGIRTKAHNH